MAAPPVHVGREGLVMRPSRVHGSGKRASGACSMPADAAVPSGGNGVAFGPEIVSARPGRQVARAIDAAKAQRRNIATKTLFIEPQKGSSARVRNLPPAMEKNVLSLKTEVICRLRASHAKDAFIVTSPQIEVQDRWSSGFQV